MPTLDKFFALAQPLFGLVGHAFGAETVLQTLSGHQPHAARLGQRKQRIHRSGMRGREHQGAGHAVAQQFLDEEVRTLGRMLGIRKTALMRKRVVLQPGQQAVCRRTDHIGLRIVDVHVDETRCQQASRQVLDRHVRMALPKGLPGPDVGNAAVVAHDQQAVAVVQSLAVVVETEQCGAIGFHGPEL